MKQIETNFEIPKDMRDAKNRLVVLRGDIEGIDEQLATNEKPYAHMPDSDYTSWRNKARAAKRWKKAEARWLRDWLQETAFTSEDLSAGGLLLASLPILNTAAEEGLIDDGNQVILEAVRGYVKNRFPAVGGLVTGTIALDSIQREEVNVA